MSRSGRHRRILRAQLEAAGILRATLARPRVAPVAESRRAPRIREARRGGLPATVVQPQAPPPWPTFVFANGATPDGRAHPVVRRLATALGKSGYAVYIPDLPGVSRGELTPATLAAAIACTADVADGSETRDGRVGLVGVSIGATVALLVAADERLAPRISVVAGIAPFSDLRKVILLATTGMYRAGSGFEPYPVPATLALGLAHSLAQMLSGEADAWTLGDELRSLAVDSSDPLAPLRFPPTSELGPDANAVRELLANRDPERFDDLYAALPGTIRDTVETLSPVCSAARIVAPVEIATSPRDRYFPTAESLALTPNPQVRVTVTSILAHATPRLDPHTVTGLVRLDRFFVRSLVAAGG